MNDQTGGQVDQRTGSAISIDVAALRNLQNYSAGALERTQSRAGKWIPGLVALVGVLTTALVIKGPESFAKLDPTLQRVIIALLVLGGLALAYGIYRAYRAAYGDPLSENDDLRSRAQLQQSDGAWEAWSAAVSAAVRDAESSLKTATVCTIIGVLILVVAVLLTWLSPTKSAADTFTCFTTDTGLVKIEGSLPAVESGSITVESCE